MNKNNGKYENDHTTYVIPAILQRPQGIHTHTLKLNLILIVHETSQKHYTQK